MLTQSSINSLSNTINKMNRKWSPFEHPLIPQENRVKKVLYKGGGILRSILEREDMQ